MLPREKPINVEEIIKIGMITKPKYIGNLPDANGLSFFLGCSLSLSRSKRSFKTYIADA